MILILFLLQSDPQCTLPPAYWCDTSETARLCGAEQTCMGFDRSVSNQTVNLTVLYESLCPDSEGFFMKILNLSVYQELKPILSLTVVPYGNVRVNGTVCIILL